MQPLFARSFGQSSWWQIEVNQVYLVCDGAVHMCSDECHCQFLAVRFVSAVVLYFDVQVETALAAVNLLTALVRTHKIAVDFFGRPAHVLFANFFFALRF